jgi:type I restriction enzyme S subunit
MSARYFQNHLSTLATGSTALGIKASKLHQLMLVTPPVQEQVQIVSHINEQSRMRDHLFLLAEHTIEHLQEHRSIVIAEAVTGKIKL